MKDAPEVSAEPEDQPLALISRRELRGNNSWMHNLPRLVKGGRNKARCVLFMHPEDAGALSGCTSFAVSVRVTPVNHGA